MDLRWDTPQPNSTCKPDKPRKIKYRKAVSIESTTEQDFTGPSCSCTLCSVYSTYDLLNSIYVNKYLVTSKKIVKISINQHYLGQSCHGLLELFLAVDISLHLKCSVVGCPTLGALSSTAIGQTPLNRRR
jgi:hypothetical protein